MDVGMQSIDSLRILVREVGNAIPVFPVSAFDETGTEDLIFFLLQTVRPLNRTQDASRTGQVDRADESMVHRRDLLV
jgi:hypothetical protein